MSSLPLLSLIVFAPWVGTVLLAFVGRHVSANTNRTLTLLSSLSTLALAGVALGSFDPSAVGYQFTERHAWINALNVNYHLGLDGLSLLLDRKSVGRERVYSSV